MNYDRKKEKPSLYAVGKEHWGETEIKDAQFTIGRGLHCSLTIQNQTVSRLHCFLKQDGFLWTITDVSTMGTYLNGKRIEKRRSIHLKEGDVVKLGPFPYFVFIFSFRDREDLGPVLARCEKGELKEASLEDSTRKASGSQVAEVEEMDNCDSDCEILETVNCESRVVGPMCERNDVNPNLLGHSSSDTNMEPKKKRLRTTPFEHCYSSSSPNDSDSTVIDLRKGLVTLNPETYVPCVDLTGSPKKNPTTRTEFNTEDPDNLSDVDSSSTVFHKDGYIDVMERKLKDLESIITHEKQQNKSLQQYIVGLEKRLQTPMIDKQSTYTQEKENCLQGMLSTRQNEQDKHTKKQNETVLIKKKLSTAERKIIDLEELLEEENHKNSGLTTQIKNKEKTLSEMQTALDKGNTERQSLSTTVRKHKEQLTTITELLENELQCSVCNEILIDPVMLGCRHMFCEFCIETWQRKRNTCPMCRTPVHTKLKPLQVHAFLDKVVGVMPENINVEHRSAVIEHRRVAVHDEVEEDIDALLEDEATAPEDEATAAGYEIGDVEAALEDEAAPEVAREDEVPPVADGAGNPANAVDHADVFGAIQHAGAAIGAVHHANAFGAVHHANAFRPFHHANAFGPFHHANAFGPFHHANAFGPFYHANAFVQHPGVLGGFHHINLAANPAAIVPPEGIQIIGNAPVDDDGPAANEPAAAVAQEEEEEEEEGEGVEEIAQPAADALLDINNMLRYPFMNRGFVYQNDSSNDEFPAGAYDPVDELPDDEPDDVA